MRDDAARCPAVETPGHKPIPMPIHYSVECPFDMRLPPQLHHPAIARREMVRKRRHLAEPGNPADESANILFESASHITPSGGLGMMRCNGKGMSMANGT
jgi:hypothetical protein